MGIDATKRLSQLTLCEAVELTPEEQDNLALLTGEHYTHVFQREKTTYHPPDPFTSNSKRRASRQQPLPFIYRLVGENGLTLAWSGPMEIYPFPLENTLRTLFGATGGRYLSEQIKLLRRGQTDPSLPREMTLFDAAAFAVFERIALRVSWPARCDMELIYGTENEAKKNEILRKFSKAYERLTPEMQEQIRVVDFREYDGGLAVPGEGYIRMSQWRVESPEFYFYHETAHLHTTLFMEIGWRIVAGNPYFRWDSWDDPLENIFGIDGLDEGLVTDYTFKKANEDIAELVSIIYEQPGFVRWMAFHSPILQGKIRHLHAERFISDEQYRELTNADAVRSFEKEWKDVAGELDPEKTAPFSYASASKDVVVSDHDFFSLGILGPIERPTDDVKRFMHLYNEYSRKFLKTAIASSDLIREKSELLLKHRFITEAQYREHLSLMKRPDEDKISHSRYWNHGPHRTYSKTNQSVRAFTTEDVKYES